MPDHTPDPALPPPIGHNTPLRSVGADLRRADAAEKTTGRALYTNDFALPGMLHAKALRSPRAHALIKRLDASRARTAPGVHAVLTRDDVPANLAATFGYFIKDQPIVATDRVRHVGDIVALVAADTEADAVAALRLIDIDYEDLPIVATIEQALAPDAPALFETAPPGIVPLYGDGARGALRPAKNICYEFAYRTGDPTAFERCDHVFTDEFRFSRMQHFHLEPFVSVARTTDDTIEIWSSCQNPFGLRKDLARIFRLPENAVSVRVPFVGGGFGAKNNCRTEPAAALLSRLAGGRPVRFCLSLEEAFFTNTQHAAILRLRTGVMADGRLVARQSEILLDAGAYSDASPLVAEKAGYRIPGPYRYEFIDSLCQCVMTNTAPAGPFRGFGGTQATWASESQIDMIARRLGIDPLEFRRRNLLPLGAPFVPGESGVDSDMVAGLDLVADAIGYHQPRKPDHGIGLAIGFKDGGGVNKPAQARIKIATAGDVFLQCATIEIGQGARTALAQIAAEILGCDIARIRQAPVDTDTAPFDQGTNASSGVAVMGQAVQRAALAVRDDILAFAARSLNCAPADLILRDWTVIQGDTTHPLVPLIMRHYGGTGFEFSAEGYYKIGNDHHAPLEAPCIFWEIGWGAAEVHVDRETGRLTVLRLVVSGDAGRAINPRICRGQDEGSALMGLSQALFEEMRFDDHGQLLNLDPLDYRVPLAEDLPADFRSILQEQGHGPGPFGAKGMGEGTMLPVASAIANAVHDAVGVRITELPITPERILRALDK
jgi:CO/xanthine dehydrogenase Mo-binding subunit